MSNDEDRLAKLERDMEHLKDQINRYKGFIGGILFVFAGIATFAHFFSDIVMIKLGLK